MKTLTIPAALDQLDIVQAFIDQMLDDTTCTPETRIPLQIAVEELFVNIASYAYAPGTGDVTVGCSIDPTIPSVTIQFRDRGIPFDPLAKEDADITLSAEERRIGGLGIYMVKEFMDELTYSYEDGQNILTMYKTLGA